MSGLRRTPALFDHLGVADDKNGGSRVSSPRAGSARRAMDGGASALGRWLGGAENQGEAADESLPRERGAGFVSMRDDRVVISLSSVSAALVVFVCVLSLIGAFELGQRRGHASGVLDGFDRATQAGAPAAADEVEAVREGPVRSDLLSSGNTTGSSESKNPSRQDLVSGSSKAAAPGVKSEWVKGRTYVIVQEFGKDAETDARKAQAFLQSRGIETAVVRLESGALRLVSTGGYDRQDAKERGRSDELIEKIRTAGAEYYKTGGGYKLEGYFATLRQDRW